LASLACAIHGREMESEQVQQLAMHLLMANPQRAHSSAVRRSSMVMQASSSKTSLQALLGQLTSHVLLDSPAFVSSTVSRDNMVGDLYSLEASAMRDVLSDKEKTKTLIKEKLLAERMRAAAQTGPKMKAKHAARAGSDADQKMTFIKDSYPFSEAGYICKKRDEMREYWMNQGRYLPSVLRELLVPSFSDILGEDGLLKEADADEEKMRKVCDEHLEKWAKIDQSKFTGADLNWADIAEGKVAVKKEAKEEPEAVEKEAEEEPKKPKPEAKKAKKPKK